MIAPVYQSTWRVDKGQARATVTRDPGVEDGQPGAWLWAVVWQAIPPRLAHAGGRAQVVVAGAPERHRSGKAATQVAAEMAAESAAREGRPA